ncbi:hypothetical protein [Metabacillus schmidteae]|uniref:hypothetical protein n=1 Tax=Metabacillus schmidteae TaxID=2730405 RepID=UPI00158CF401|nr:hypothetical protein [Metabacillus schmidteae]
MGLEEKPSFSEKFLSIPYKFNNKINISKDVIYYGGAKLEFHEAAKLRNEWVKKNSKECDHPKIEQRYLGEYAGDYACKVCGQTFLSPLPESKGEK